jgi:glycosyltransferase involved in cell wall biosynthesis
LQPATKPVRIVYLNPCGQLGGAEISLLDLLAGIRAGEPAWELHLVLGEGGPLEQRAQALGVQVVVASFPGALARWGDSGSRPVAALGQGFKAITGTLSYLMRLRRVLSTIKPDIIHTNGFKMHILGIWARPEGTPVVWHVRDYVSSRSVMKRLLRLHARDCAVAIGNSKSVAEDIQRVCGSRVDAICIYNAVDLAQYSPDGPRADLDSMSGLPPAKAGTLRIGLIATLAHWKGHAVFLRALAQLADELDYRAYVIGGPIYQTGNSQQVLDDLRALAMQLGISQRIGFTGFVAKPADAMRALDIIVHASTQPEPFGRVIAEGMACGRAVICSAAGGALELVTNGRDALTHEPGNHLALADRIAKLAQDADLRARLGRAGRVTAERRFRLSRLAEEVIPVYRRITTRATRGTSAELAAVR